MVEKLCAAFLGAAVAGCGTPCSSLDPMFDLANWCATSRECQLSSGVSIQPRVDPAYHGSFGFAASDLSVVVPVSLAGPAAAGFPLLMYQTEATVFMDGTEAQCPVNGADGAFTCSVPSGVSTIRYIYAGAANGGTYLVLAATLPTACQD
jgi:hypothetical protein